MKNGLTFSILIFSVILLSIFVSAVSISNQKLKKQKEELILKSDSLHILQLEANKELSWTRYRLDSLLSNNKKK